MKKKILALLLGISFVLVGCGGDNESADGGSAKKPENLYNQKCSSCHGSELQGSGTAIPNLTEVGARLSEDEIEDIILNGRGKMAGGYLKGADATAVAEWLSEKK